MNRLRFAWPLLLAAIWSSAAHTAHAPACTLSTNGLAFGSYAPTSAIAVTANGSISFTCTHTHQGFTAYLTISPGNSGTYTNRTLNFGGQSLNYNIYVNAADTEIFGDGTGGGVGGTYYYTLCYAGGGVVCSGGGGRSGTQYVEPMYGLLPAGQDVSAGTYSDTIIATLTY
jgi:spore coat protein U domain-containing protein, fimbrial subunit CupE1/2/3/6